MWVWKDPDQSTGEKGVVMFLRIYSYAKWKPPADVYNRLKKNYNIILGEHLEVCNISYDKMFKDSYERYLSDFDLWFYSSKDAYGHTTRRSNGNAADKGMKMSAVCYLVDQKFWTPDSSVDKVYDACACFNWVTASKKPNYISSLWREWRESFPKARFAFICGNTAGNSLFGPISKIMRRIGGVDFILDPDPETIRDIYRKSKCIWHPSSSESGPRVVGEAMSCGLPAVVLKSKWNESIEHLIDGVLRIGKDSWKTPVGVAKILQLNDYLIKERINPRALVNTDHYVNLIDEKLKSINPLWTMGKLNPPLWIGTASPRSKSDELFEKIVGKVIV